VVNVKLYAGKQDFEVDSALPPAHF